MESSAVSRLRYKSKVLTTLSYPLNNHLAPLTSRTGANAGLAVNTVEPGQSLSPEDDKLATRGIPIFRPTLEEFEVSYFGFE